MTLADIIKSKVSRISITAATVVTAAVLAFGGLSPVGAQAATGTYDCGTYGGGSYDQTDCTDSTGSTGSSSGSSSSSGSTGSTSGSSSSTGSSSSSTGSTTTTTTGTTVLLNDFSEYTDVTGKSLSFKVGDVIYFNLKGTKHTITIKSITPSTLVVTIASTPTDVSVGMGQTVNYDVDQDGTADIAITYSQVASDASTATAIFKALGTTASTGTSSTGSGTSSSTGGTTTTTENGSMNLWWIWIFPVIIGIGLIIWAVIAAKRRKAAANANGGLGGGSNFNQF